MLDKGVPDVIQLGSPAKKKLRVLFAEVSGESASARV